MIRGNVKIVTELLSPWRRGRGCGSAVGILDQLSRFRRRIRAGHSTGEPRHPRSPVTAPQAGTVDPPARALSLRGVALMLVCAGLLVLPDQVLAQTAYVSNRGQTVGIPYRADVNFKQAQQFTTGSQGGYTLGRVGVVVASSPSTTGLTVAIYSSSGDNNPDALLHTLTNPSSLTADTEALFTPSSTVTLAASTSYFIVVAKTGTVLQLCSTRSDADDAGGSAGWSIANSRREESGGIWVVGDDALKISVYPPSNNNTATGKPAITGTPQVGQTLTAGIGTIADADGLTTRTFPGDYTFQWIRVDGGTETDIGSDQNTYTPVAADVGKKVKVQVNFTDDLVNDESLTSAAYPSSGSILAAKSACPADATGGTGWCATMTVGTTDETSGGDRIRSYGFKFKVGVGSLIGRFFTHAGTDYEVARVRRVLTTRGGSVDSDYMTLWTDKAVPDGTLLKVDGRTAAFTIGPDSDDTEAVGAEQWDLETLGNPPNWVEGQKVTVSLNFPPTLSASAAPGMTLVLTYDETLDDTSVPAASAYAVTVDGSDRTVSSVAISGQTVTLTLASAVTLGQTVIVSYTVPGTNPVQDDDGIDAAALTDEVVTSVNNVATGAPTITGTPQVGQTLTAGIGTIADDNGLPTTFPNDYTFQWTRVDGASETAISGATQRNYTLAAADEGKQIKVKVSFTDDHDYDESRTSTAYPARGYPSSAIAIVAAKSACPTGNNWCETMEWGTRRKAAIPTTALTTVPPLVRPAPLPRPLSGMARPRTQCVTSS